MGNLEWKKCAKGLALSTAYCSVYLILWYFSSDQWFLPAGLRAACLLLLPYRYWPYMLAGDAGALLTLRAPKADTYGEMWAYLSPFMLLPMVSMVAIGLRRKLTTMTQQAQWLPLSAIAIASASSIANLILNEMLSGPKTVGVVPTLLKFAIGHYLGAMMAMPILLGWMQHAKSKFPLKPLIQDALIAAAMIGAMYALAVWTPTAHTPYRQLVLMLMILSAALLAVLHGWNGASIGVILVNIAIGLSIPDSKTAGNFDKDAFVAQQALAVVATLIIIFGNRISDQFEKMRRTGLAESNALLLAQKGFFSSEQIMREQLLYMAHRQLGMDDDRKETVDWLRTNGHAKAAMDLNTRGMMRRRVFDTHAPALYPIRIEQDGLFAVVYSRTFIDFWANDAELICRFKGIPQSLTLDMQLSAYRCICHAMTILSGCRPGIYRVGIRVWRGTHKRGVLLSVTAVPTAYPEATRVGLAATAMLDDRVRAHRGICRNNHHRVRILLSESNEAVSTPLEPVPVY